MLTVELVRRGAARHARRTAVRSGDQSLTFAEVDAAANRRRHGRGWDDSRQCWRTDDAR